MPTNPTTPELLSEEALERIASYKPFQYGTMVSMTVAERDALCQNLRAARAQKFVAEDLLHVATESLRKSETENDALREQLAEAQQLAETRSDIIAAKAAHVDQLQSQLTGHGTSSLLRRLKDFLFENCNHSERDRNYDWCPSCVMAFIDVIAQPSNTELKEQYEECVTCIGCGRPSLHRKGDEPL